MSVIRSNSYLLEVKKYFEIEYIEAAFKTANMNFRFETRIRNWCFGLEGEFGELIDVIKKFMFHGHEFNDAVKNKCVKEIGDLCWYIAVICEEMNLDISEDYVFYTDLYNDKFQNIMCILNDMKQSKDFIYYKINNYGPSFKEKFTLDKETIKLIYLICYLCELLEIDFKEVLTTNIKKLNDRYNGQFSIEKSINRKENA